MIADAGGQVVLDLPFDGPWLVRNSPARRVPSHGTDLWGERYAIDFVGVDARHRTAPADWRALVATEPPERFVSFGRPILAPADGTVVEVHDREADHEARRSQLALVPYALGQAARVAAGVDAIAGNRVVLRLGTGTFIALVHLRASSALVGVGDAVTTGMLLAACGNSGNSTQPHLHLQAMDSRELAAARGIPMRFRRFREVHRGRSAIREFAVPAEGSVVERI
jgi:hypothetical protein